VKLHVRHQLSLPGVRRARLAGLPCDRTSCANLLEATTDPSLEVARFALARLAELGGPEEASTLRSRLLDFDLALVPAVVTTLRALGDTSVSVVAVEGLKAPALSQRLAAGIALRELADDRARASLLAALRDPIAGVRLRVLDALAVLPAGAQIEEACSAMLSDGDRGVREAAVRALLRVSHDPERHALAILADSSKSVRRELARASSRFSDEVVRSLLTDTHFDVRETTAWALANAPRETLVPDLVSRLDDPEWSVRRAAARALGAAHQPAAVSPLISHLCDPSLIVRAASLRSLREIAGGSLDETLASHLNAADPGLRAVLVEALGVSGSESAAQHVARRADDESPAVRIAVAHVLGLLRSTESRTTLDRLSRDLDEGVRHAAAVALAGPATEGGRWR
jgi:HEAT repeat protein